MNQSIQSISLAATTTLTRPTIGRRVRQALPVLASLRARLRSFRVRSTLGPSFGDQVLGESQWRSSGSGFSA
jgi:hypothetical protein